MKLKKEIEKIIIDYALDNVTTDEAVNAIMELVTQKLEEQAERFKK